MINVILWILAILCLVFGFLGCFVNKIPGPIFVVIAMLIGILGLDLPFGWGTFAIVVVLAIVSIILSKTLVSLARNIQEFGKRASLGTTIGSMIGILLLLASANQNDTMQLVVMGFVGLLVLPFVFAFLLELTRKQGAKNALLCATSATIAYVADTMLKLVVFVFAVYKMFVG